MSQTIATPSGSQTKSGENVPMTRSTRFNWDDPSVPVGNSPPYPRWPLALMTLLWVAWVVFLIVMLVQERTTSAAG